MRNLLTETPHAEVTATLEALATLGIERRDLGMLRRLKDREHTRTNLVRLIKFGDPADPIPTSSDLTLRHGRTEGGTARERVMEHHRMQSPIVWDRTRYEKSLFRPRIRSALPKTIGQVADQYILKDLPGNRFRRPMTANILDFLLGYPELVPRSWKGHFVIFAGTRFRGTNGIEYYATMPPYEAEFGTHVNVDEPFCRNHYFALY